MVGVAIRTCVAILAGSIENRVNPRRKSEKLRSRGRLKARSGSIVAGSTPCVASTVRARAFSAGSLLSDLTRRAREGSATISRYCWTVARAETRIWLSGSTSRRLRYSIESGRFQKPGLESASVSPSLRRAGVSSARADKSSFVEPLPAQRVGKPFTPRTCGRGPRTRIGHRAAEDIHHLFAGLGDIDEWGPSKQRLDCLQTLRRGQVRPGVEDNRQDLGIVHDRPAQNREQARRDFLSVHQPADRTENFRARDKPFTAADQPQGGISLSLGPVLKGRSKQREWLGHFQTTTRVHLIRNDGSCRVRTPGSGSSSSRKKTV